MFRKLNARSLRIRAADWFKIIVLLLDEAVIITLVVLALRYFKIQIPLPLTVIIIILLGILVFIIHKAIIPSFHWRPVSGSEGMIGTLGTVIEPLTPKGSVNVRGERWNAKSVGDNIETGENVEIVGLEGLTLQVKRQES
ncbi:MAG: hypothetical protein JSW16_01295 [Dehalococcoidales bacterium]|nr:MAG: hypothetical protein JSW16_01295 [Dehalococcoidales bacterium]